MKSSINYQHICKSIHDIKGHRNNEIELKQRQMITYDQDQRWDSSWIISNIKVTQMNHSYLQSILIYHSIAKTIDNERVITESNHQYKTLLILDQKV